MNTTGGNDKDVVTRKEFEELEKRVTALEQIGYRIRNIFQTVAGVFRSAEEKPGENDEQ